jgi:predicted nucleic acid-binding protein
MEITIDASVLLAVCTNEPSKPKLIALTAGASLVAPASIHWEIGNALSAMLKRGRIDLGQAQACVQAYSEIPIKFVEVELIQALTLAQRFRMYAYDAYLLACAVQYHSPLFTLDGALRTAAKQLGISVIGEDR